jgi:hypothetical protein
MNIGNVEDAKRVLAHHHHDKHYDDVKAVGSGAFRYVYRVGDVVYKIDGLSWEGATTNIGEWESYQRLIESDNLPAGVSIPKTALYTFTIDDTEYNVICMEYIDGGQLTDTCYGALHTTDCDVMGCTREREKAIGEAMGIVDIHNGNYIVPGVTNEQLDNLIHNAYVMGAKFSLRHVVVIDLAS